MPQDHAKNDSPPGEDSEAQEQKGVLDSGIHRSHSSLSHHSTYSIQSPPSAGKATEAVYMYHSVPLTMLEVTKSYSIFGVIFSKIV